MGGRLRATLAAAVTAALCLAAVTACSASDPDPAPGAGSDPASAGGTPSGAGGGSASEGAEPGDDDTPASDGASPGEPGDDGGGIEMPPPGDQESGLPGLDPPDTGPLVSLPLPDQASSKGALVTGYPRRAFPVAPRSRIRASSVSPADARLQVALTATTTLKPGRVLLFYRLHLAGLGFQEVPTTAVGGSSAAAFERGGDSAVVTVTPGKAAAAYSVFGTLTAGKG